jgi:hypothetical protein
MPINKRYFSQYQALKQYENQKRLRLTKLENERMTLYIVIASLLILIAII